LNEETVIEEYKPMSKKLTCARAQTATPMQPTPLPKVQVPYSMTFVASLYAMKLDTRTGQIWQV
jgi:hypothetical protein